MSYLDTIRTFIHAYDLCNMSAAGRDLRISPAVIAPVRESAGQS